MYPTEAPDAAAGRRVGAGPQDRVVPQPGAVEVGRPWRGGPGGPHGAEAASPDGIPWADCGHTGGGGGLRTTPGAGPAAARAS
jgi:hypothetical protein